MKSPKTGIGLLIGVKPKGSDAGEEDEEGMEGPSEVKLAAAKALMSAVAAKDAEAFVEALDTYMDC